MKTLTYQNYAELSVILTELQSLNEKLKNEELKKSQELSYVKLRIKQIALQLDVIFQYADRVISGNVTYSINKTTSLVSCLKGQIVSFKNYILTGIYYSDSYEGLAYIKLLHLQQLYFAKGMFNKNL